MLVGAFGSIAGARSRVEELQSNYSELLASLRDGLNQSLRRCGQPCGNVSLGALAFSANFSAVRRGRARGEGSPRPPPQPAHPGLFPADPRCGAAAEGTARCVWLQHRGQLRGGKGGPAAPGLGAPGAAGLGCGGLAWEEPCWELIAGAWRNVRVRGLPWWEPACCPRHPRVLAWSGLGAGGDPGCPVPSGDGGDVLLSPGLWAGT